MFSGFSCVFSQHNCPQSTLWVKELLPEEWTEIALNGLVYEMAPCSAIPPKEPAGPLSNPSQAGKGGA